MMDKIVLNKLVNNEETVEAAVRILYVKSKWSGSQIDVFLQDSETGKCYNGCLTTSKVIEISNDLGLSCEEYCKQCYELLTTNVPLDGYIYELNSEFKKLTIRKLPLNCIFLDIDLYECANNFEFLEDAIAIFQQQNIMLQEQLGEVEEVYKQFELVKADFYRIAEEKAELESTLMKKFVVLLNNKKLRIAELQKRLRKYEGDTNDQTEDSDDEDLENQIIGAINRATEATETTETTDTTEAAVVVTE